MAQRLMATSRVRRGAVLACLMISASVFLAGCGKREKIQKPVPVKGVVLFKGKPLANAQVNFIASGASMPSTGRTNDAGEFELTMFKTGDGALEGVNKVTVAVHSAEQNIMATPDPLKLATGKAENLPDLTQRRKNEADPKTIIPKIYSDTVNSPLSWTVKPGGDSSVKLELN
jgi:hypothetical protein